MTPQDCMNKQSRIIGKDYRDHLSMLACVSMTCGIVPPMFIITGRSEAKYEQFVPVISGYSVIATDKGTTL